MFEELSKSVICLPSEVICASPESDCSSRRRRPSFVSHRRPSAPEVSAEEVPGSEPEGSRLFLNVMRAVRPSWLGALIASLIAWASALGAGTGPEPPSAPWAIAAEVTRMPAHARIVSRRRVEVVRSLLMRQLYARTLRDL